MRILEVGPSAPASPGDDALGPACVTDAMVLAFRRLVLRAMEGHLRSRVPSVPTGAGDGTDQMIYRFEPTLFQGPTPAGSTSSRGSEG